MIKNGSYFRFFLLFVDHIIIVKKSKMEDIHMKKKMIEGQLDLFTYIEEQFPEKEPALQSGEIIYVVLKGEVIPYIVDSEKPWYGNFEKKHMIFRTKRLDVEGIWGIAKEIDENHIWFKEKIKAKTAADIFIHTHDVMLAKDINIQEGHFYENEEGYMIGYGIINDNYIYMKKPSQYHHIVKNNSRSVKDFMCFVNGKYHEIQITNERLHQINFFKNMYRCSNSDWIYGQAEYCGATGISLT